jgi:hypothetical protein
MLYECLPGTKYYLTAKTRSSQSNTPSIFLSVLRAFVFWIKGFYKGFQAHVGEIVAIEALMEKAGS